MGWLQRVDVNYRGSTGHGLAYREAIKVDGWGGHEQDDIAAGAQSLIDAGLGTGQGGRDRHPTAVTVLVPDHPYTGQGDRGSGADLRMTDLRSIMRPRGGSVPIQRRDAGRHAG